MSSSGWDLGRESVLRGGAGVPAADAGAQRTQKYAVEGVIGRGGMGEILLVSDHDLRRQVAMKVILPEGASDADRRLQFVAEAQATSQLEHPGIPPVHDIGVAPDGRLYFTMKLVRGRTLREVLHDLFVKRPEVQREWTLHRLVGVLERLCEALHFAHERGVVHRDLKPDNVMLGDYGEVHLMDWGLARVEGEVPRAPEPTPSQADLDRVLTARTDAALRTEFGLLKGTLPYMAPEQLLGAVDRRTDVYALGCVLYEVLTLQMAFDPHAPDLLDAVRAGTPPELETRNPRRPVPPALGDICRRAMAKQADQRPPTALALGQALRAWLDGSSERERRHRDAEEFVARGREAMGAHERAKAAVVRAEQDLESTARCFSDWQPVSEKGPLLEARQGLAQARRAVTLAFAGALKWLDAALVQEERNASARAALSDLWRAQLEEAEHGGDVAQAAHALEMVKRFDDGRLAALLSGEGRLDLSSTPSGAEVTLYRFLEQAGVWAASEARPLGRTPVAQSSLPMGSYLCVLRLPGMREVRYPVFISRNRSWVGHVRLRTEAELGEGFVYVPAGPFLFGEGKSAATLELPDFAIARSAVTFDAYAQFLEAMEQEHGREAAARHVPGTAGDGPYYRRTDAGTYRPVFRPLEDGVQQRYERDYGPDFVGRLPVLGVSWHDAEAYCAWKTRTTGRTWRLPSEQEREKASRGVDGRRFPWGDLEDASLCKCRDSRNESSQPEPVGTFRTATSVYGMLDAAGNSWDWTRSLYEPHIASSTRLVSRGGSWYNAATFARCAVRDGSSPASRSDRLGFRPVLVLEG